MRKPAQFVLLAARALAAAALIAGATLGCRGERAGQKDAAVATGPVQQDLMVEQTPDALVEALVRANLDAELALKPTLASWLGDHGYDDKLDDVRTDAQLHEATRLRQLADQLRAIPEAPLAAPARLDRRLLLRRTEAALHELSELRPLERNPLFYVDIAQVGVESLVADARTLDPDTLRALNGRLARVRGLFDEARRNLRGSTPELAARRAVDGAQALRAFVAEALPKLVQGVPDARAVEDARAAIGDATRALDEFAGWLQRDFLPRAHGELSLGPARRRSHQRAAEAVPGSIDVLIPRVDAALRDADRRVDEAARAVLASTPVTPPRTLSDVPRLIEDDHGKAEELLLRAQAVTDQLFQQGRALGLPVPATGLPHVAEMPPQLSGFVRVVAAAPLEKRAREPVLYVDPAPPSGGRVEHLRLFNRPTMVVTLAHELLGHFLVGLRRRQAPTLMQRVSASVLLDEGLAGYVERVLLAQPPFAADWKARLVAERDARLRIVRLLASIRFHAQGVRLEEIARLFGDSCGLDEYTARREAERVALDPFAGVDALGRLELERLRDDFFAAHPTATNEAFFAALLSHGGTPPELLRELILTP